jgi:hypothetical protein
VAIRGAAPTLLPNDKMTDLLDYNRFKKAQEANQAEGLKMALKSLMKSCAKKRKTVEPEEPDKVNMLEDFINNNFTRSDIKSESMRSSPRTVQCL